MIAFALSIAGRAAAPAIASGSGPDLSLGVVAANNLPVNAATSAAQAFKGFNVHIHMEFGGGVSAVTVAADNTGTILPGSVFCAGPTVPVSQPLPRDSVYGCTALGRARGRRQAGS